MTKLRSPAALNHYRRDGFLFPIPVLSSDEAREHRRRLEALETAHGGQIGDELRHKPHLLLTWLADPVWSTSFFIKNAHDPAYVSWHQDATYWGLSEPSRSATSRRR